MKKIVFIGAGSFHFTTALARDILTFPAFADCEIALVDIDASRLKTIKKAVDRIVEAGNYPAKVTAYTDRREALPGADGILSTVLMGGLDVFRHDLEIPLKYGVNINIGDTRGPAGIFRALRTIPLMLDICRDIEKYCPDAVFLNYTNPMAMLCRAMQAHSKVNVTGLCHSVQGTTEMLAKWIGADMKDVEYLCAGINHQAFYLDFKWNGKDAYPAISEAVGREDIYIQEMVRNDIFKTLGYYITESSGHNSEYCAWFRKRPDLIERYNKGTGWNPGVYGYTITEHEKKQSTYAEDIEKWIKEDIDIERGPEYAAYIFNAMFGDGTLFEFNGNVRNFGLIENLPYGCCVEVPVIASKYGLKPVRVGNLPHQLAALINTSAYSEELAVEGCMEGDPKKIFQAICFDPLTAAVCSLDEIKAMTNELFAFNKEWLPHFKHIKVN